MRRIAKGLKRHVIDAAEPFFVPHFSPAPSETVGEQLARREPLGGAENQARATRAPTEMSGSAPSGADFASPFITEFANAGNGGRTWSAGEPLRTQCAGVKGGHFAVVAPILAGVGGRAGQTEPRPANQPHYTFTAKADCALIAAFLEQANGGFAADNSGHDLRKPVSTITASGSQQRLVTADVAELSPEQEAGALRVAAFLINYYGNGTALDVRDPLDTITTRDRMALVTVMIGATPYVITDIRLRMLKPRELFTAQGFPPDYIIDRTANGSPLTTSAAVRMVGNSVSPAPIAALARANLDPVLQHERMAA
jgi:DNA (cytosine-5)-methyltransferase 1